MSKRDCILDMDLANEIVHLTGGVPGADGTLRPGSGDPRQIAHMLADYLNYGDREIIPGNHPAMENYARALIELPDLRTRFLEYAILRGAACLSEGA